ncbi:protein FAR1-RELATED SEQUENCE 5-like [Rutidosis leptorrhynchoides]|uniref:protein FAR1-RELATED SEQUENCE 5-like n=1 Tax=Rutidosis leptorrhynchoides TaxID=125765 RepID=UPI003A99243C
MRYFDMNFVQDLASKSNIGPMLAHHINCDISGGYDMVGPTNVDYKNFRRDLLRHIGETDAHIVIENLLRKKELSKMNYKEFGDIVSFDATYGTNRYNMRFVPITGIDNHKKLVIFGAALLSRETIDSYKWFIDCILKTFSTEPDLVTTDQDPAVLEAVAEKFKTTKHRLCMWHISQKLKDKVGYILIEDFELDGAKWFDNMYAIMEMWIPCFFRDVPMNGLMRTSSLSESENSFFSKCKNKHSNLVDFFSRFDVAMDKQHHNARLIDSQMESRSIKCRTVKPIELQARDVCVADGDDELKKICEVQEKFIPPRKKLIYKISFHSVSGEAHCSCLLFNREGRLYRHIFHVYEINDIFKIPKQHILRRWTRDASESLNVIFASVNYHSDAYLITKHLINTFRRVVSNCKNDKEILQLFSDRFDGFVKEFAHSIPDQHSSVTKVQQIENVLGFSKPSNVKVHAPVVVPNKGQRSSKRYKSAREEAASKSSVNRRKCQRCKGIGHNVRTCTAELDSEFTDSEDDD